MNAEQLAKLAAIGPDGLTGEQRAALPEPEWLRRAIERMDYLLDHPNDLTNIDPTTRKPITPARLAERRAAYQARLDALGV